MYIFNPKSDPDTSKCRTRKVGAVIPVAGREMFYCGIDHAECRYAMQLAWDYICKHPDNASFNAGYAPDEEFIGPEKLDSLHADDNLPR